MKDSLNLLKILKETTIGDIKYRYTSDKKKPESLIQLGYICDDLLSFESTLVFYNEEKQKLILVIDGIKGEYGDLLFSFNIFLNNNLKKVYNYISDRDNKTKQIFLDVTIKYSNYNKICLGYSLGGYFITKYMDNSFSKGYIYNGISLFKNKNIINYVSNTDLLSLTSSIVNIGNISLLKNDFKNLLLIFNSKLWSEKNHELDAIDENSIPLIIF
jgi:hypothetical protein